MRGQRNREKHSLWYLRRYTLKLGLLWTAAIVSLTVYSFLSLRARALGEALVRGRSLYEQDLLYLEWNDAHGGAYVPGTGENPPNHFLTPVADGEATTAAKPRLKLVNPAYMGRETDRMGETLPGIKGQLTSLKPLNPDNRAAGWEAEAMLAFGQGEAEVRALVQIDGRDYLRLMQPFRARQECLICHGRQGYLEGDILGGLALSLPVDDLLSIARRQSLATSAGYLGLWLLGVAGLRLGESRLRQQILAAQRSRRLRRRLHQRLAHMEQHDRLTGLPNRALFSDRLSLALASARRFDGQMAVAVLGLDHFRMINHSYGHAAGDLVLKEAAARLTGCLRSDDTVARLGNGRFLLLFPNIRHSDDGARLAHKIQEAFLPSFIVGGQDLYLTVSLGLAMYPEDGGEENELLRNADAALSRAQDQGVSGFQLYTASLNERAVARITLENQLRRALDLGQLTLHYQPQVDVRTDAIIGAEALIRWHHPELGEIPPDQFIPVAEESGQILTIGEWVLRTACLAAAGWQELIGSPLPVAVNLSPRQFGHPGLVDLIEAVLKETGLRPEYLELEIVESSVIGDIDRAIKTLSVLKGRGIKVAIDDFGTGYSSLNYLKQFPIDRIKIDRSFVHDLDHGGGGDDAALVGLIAEIAGKMGLTSLGEGVETVAQKRLLQACRCHLMQGYLFSPPLTEGAFLSLLRSGSGRICPAV